MKATKPYLPFFVSLYTYYDYPSFNPEHWSTLWRARYSWSVCLSLSFHVSLSLTDRIGKLVFHLLSFGNMSYDIRQNVVWPSISYTRLFYDIKLLCKSIPVKKFQIHVKFQSLNNLNRKKSFCFWVNEYTSALIKLCTDSLKSDIS